MLFRIRFNSDLSLTFLALGPGSIHTYLIERRTIEKDQITLTRAPGWSLTLFSLPHCDLENVDKRKWEGRNSQSHSKDKQKRDAQRRKKKN